MTGEWQQRAFSYLCLLTHLGFDAHSQSLVLRPFHDLGSLAGQYEPLLPRGFRFLTRSLGTRETSRPDFLSLLMFQPQ